MSNLITQYGANWFISKFGGSIFMLNGEPHIVTPDSSGWRTQVPCNRLDLADNGFSVTRQDVRVSADVFTDASVFAIPNLGWRSLDKGRLLVYLSRNNSSYHRGLASRNLNIETSSLTTLLHRRGGYTTQINPIDYLRAAAMPEFMTLMEGIEKIRNEEILSFAVSSTVAVLPLNGEQLRVMFKQKVAGIINPDNTMQLALPELSSYMENMV